MRYNVPIFLTWLRVAMIPLVVGIFYVPIEPQWQNSLATIMFTVAAITDCFDGYLARRWEQTTKFGAFLDPVADKLIVAGALLVLVELGRVHAILAFIIIGREIAVSALREWMASVGQSQSVAVSRVGKFKTICQMVSIPMLLHHDTFLYVFNVQFIGSWLLIIAAVLTIWSMLYYLSIALPLLRGRL